MSAVEDARAALLKYYTVSTQGFGAGEHMNLAYALRILSDEHETLIREMHHRELHHFETEKLLTEAGIDPDSARAV